jgi:hypothetical protein
MKSDVADSSGRPNGIWLGKERACIGVAGLIAALLSVVPLLLPEELLWSLRPDPLLLWIILLTPPFALAANLVAVACGGRMVVGVIGLVVSATTCVLWAYRLVSLFWVWQFWQNGPICP